jgi:hypothetical protein
MLNYVAVLNEEAQYKCNVEVRVMSIIASKTGSRERYLQKYWEDTPDKHSCAALQVAATLGRIILQKILT